MGLEQIDGRLDLYALGCILFEMIAGRVPFDGANFAEIFDQHLDAAPPRLDVVAKECPADLADLVDQMLEKEPADRPRSAQAVVERLELLLADELTGSSPGSPDDTPEQHSDPGDQPNLTKRLQGEVTTTEAAKPAYGLGFAAGMVLLVALLLLAIKSCG